MPGRPPKPTAIHLLQGTAQKCRIDARKGELLLPGGMPEAPDWMPAEAQREWGRITSISKYAKCLTEADRGTLTMYCLQWAALKASVAGVEMPDGSMSFPQMQTSEKALMMNIAAKLGMNPSDRVKIRMPEEPKAVNKFAGIGS